MGLYKIILIIQDFSSLLKNRPIAWIDTKLLLVQVDLIIMEGSAENSQICLSPYLYFQQACCQNMTLIHFLNCFLVMLSIVILENCYFMWYSVWSLIKFNITSILVSSWHTSWIFFLCRIVFFHQGYLLPLKVFFSSYNNSIFYYIIEF